MEEHQEPDEPVFEEPIEFAEVPAPVIESLDYEMEDRERS